jgi:hypothetical protein
MFQVHISSILSVSEFHLDISKVNLREAHVAASAPPWVTMPPWVTTRLLVLLLLRACGRVKQSGLEVVLTHAWACAASGAGWVRAPGS